MSSEGEGTSLNPLHTPTHKSKGLERKGKYINMKICKTIAVV